LALFAVGALFLGAAGMGAFTNAAEPSLRNSPRVAADQGVNGAASITYLDQGWTEELRHKFYFTPQGSQFFPYVWFRALEMADDAALFAAPVNLEKFGWIYADAKDGGLNPDNLPIGFTSETTELPGAGKWLGLNCAACHTANISSAGTVIRLDGAPALADFSLFLRELSRAVTANHPAVNAPKFQRFAMRVLGADAGAAELAKLSEQYTVFAVRFSGRAWMRTPPVHPGPGRVDALTQITNALAVFDLGVPDNLFPPAAPTSYPFLWLTPQLDWVQWNPIASNPIARNAGQVLGVFGDVDLGPDPATRYTSTIEFRNLYEMEQWIAMLKPPRWPEQLLGKVDEAKWKEGKNLFDRNCRACHNMPPFDLTEKKDNIGGLQFIKINRVPQDVIGTDPVYVQSILGRFVYTDRLAASDFGGAKAVPAFRFFSTTVGRATERGFNDLKLTPAERLAYSGYRFYPKNNAADPNERPRPYVPASYNDLKAGPLLGIWATAPFLHNGSVPNLYELLSAPETRSKTFWTGSNELDREKLGYVSAERPGMFRFDTSIPGNRNGGHIYPARPYAHEQKMAVIEYLKDPERY
jgi:mono/diheme cytochrome c family protein